MTRGRGLRCEVLAGMGCHEVTVGSADGMLVEGVLRVGREVVGPGRPFLGMVYMVGREILFGAESERMVVRFDRGARRRSIRVDPDRSGHLSGRCLVLRRTLGRIMFRRAWRRRSSMRWTRSTGTV